MAEDAPPLGLTRGEVLEVDPDQFSIRTLKNQVFRFRVDAKTFIERENQQVAFSTMKKGDIADVVCDRGPESSLRYARLVKVAEVRPLATALQRPVLPRRAPYPTMSLLDSIFPRGQLTFTGVVLTKQDDRMLLRTRADGEKLIRLRPDTNFMESGRPVENAMLKTQTRVFIRAGHGLDNDLEAYSIIWGDIVDPKR